MNKLLYILGMILAMFFILLFSGCRQCKDIAQTRYEYIHDTITVEYHDTIRINSTEIVYKLTPSDTVYFTSANDLQNTIKSDNYTVESVELKTSDLSAFNTGKGQVNQTEEKGSQIEEKQAKTGNKFNAFIALIIIAFSFTFGAVIEKIID